MKVLVINSGSSSLKYQLYDMTDESVLAKGLVERIGMESSILNHKPTGGQEVTEVKEILEHNTAIRKVLAMLTDSEHGVIESIDEIDAVGHRVVHGGESFKASALVDDNAKSEIRRLIDLAPLHNPAAMMGITASEANMPGIPMVVVFDTAFHQDMPKKAYLYAIPKVLYNKYKVRRYGFHGTSHEYVSKAAAEFLGQSIEDLKIITCHIGNGGSITAVLGGHSVDTSMGMTPLEGLMMGTRSGDLDPAIVPYVMNKEELTVNEVNSMLNKHSGLLAISGVSSDMREITDGLAEGDPNCTLAFEMYEYRMRKYIGSYAAAMNGVDVIVFTAGVGENSVVVREKVCENLTYLGVEIDDALNAIRSGEPRLISTANSKVKVLVVPTNEELVIARDTYRIVNESK
ncbi:acetate/propionate family kinase [Paenibacillus crassostreae]|uniref:Acetate kinase n=1 Tax=Paenibacillus crassostreae TaxID=1763538 RepID=A0A167DLR1_9BACL|nr:acetate kinase [Paenibacillus crassostreae]AOZ91304.1 acetate kinase [Paenibacillus crassostreae]OAB74538.1 acetate kinase [Paenibacillus crassostreae]